MWAPLHLTRTKLAAGLVRILMVGTKRKRGVDSSAGAATAPVTIAYELPEVPTPEPASAAGTPKKKKTQKEPLPKRDPPSDWEKVWQIIEGYRGDHPAAVDTMGCERLADTDAGDKVKMILGTFSGLQQISRGHCLGLPLPKPRGSHAELSNERSHHRSSNAEHKRILSERGDTI